MPLVYPDVMPAIGSHFILNERIFVVERFTDECTGCAFDTGILSDLCKITPPCYLGGRQNNVVFKEVKISKGFVYV